MRTSLTQYSLAYHVQGARDSYGAYNHNTRYNKIILVRYILYYNNAFEILTTIYKKLIYIGKYPLNLLIFILITYIIAFNTIFEYIRHIWYSPFYNNYAWISACYTYYNKEKAQKNPKGIIPI